MRPTVGCMFIGPTSADPMAAMRSVLPVTVTTARNQRIDLTKIGSSDRANAPIDQAGDTVALVRSHQLRRILITMSTRTYTVSDTTAVQLALYHLYRDRRYLDSLFRTV